MDSATEESVENHNNNNNKKRSLDTITPEATRSIMSQEAVGKQVHEEEEEENSTWRLSKKSKKEEEAPNEPEDQLFAVPGIEIGSSGQQQGHPDKKVYLQRTASLEQLLAADSSLVACPQKDCPFIFEKMPYPVNKHPSVVLVCMPTSQPQ